MCVLIHKTEIHITDSVNKINSSVKKNLVTVNSNDNDLDINTRECYCKIDKIKELRNNNRSTKIIQVRSLITVQIVFFTFELASLETGTT